MMKGTIIENLIKILEITIWPTITLVAMFIFQKDLRSILKRLTKVETSTTKLMFNEEIKELEQSIPNKEDTESIESNKWISEMNTIAEINPRASIIEAWTSIEIACIEKGMIQGSAMMRFSPKMLEDYLKLLKDFDNDMIKRVMDLRRLRNRVAHGKDAEFDFIDAKKYIELADKTLLAIRNI
jgi:hypothetical protein